MKPLAIAFLVVTIALALCPLLAAEDAAMIVVYLPWEGLRHSRLKIAFDDVLVAELQPGRFFVINASPGSHVLVVGNGIPAVVETRAQSRAFVRATRHIQVGPSGKVDISALEVLSAEQAHSDLINLVYVSPKKIFSSLVNKTDPFSNRAPELKSRKSHQ